MSESPLTTAQQPGAEAPAEPPAPPAGKSTEGEVPTEEPAADGEPGEGGRRVLNKATLEQEGEVAADYLEELLDICDLDGDLDLDVEGDRAVVAIVGTGLDHLVGDNGRALDALQELTRLAVLAHTGQRSRLMLDIAGYRAGRRAELTSVGTAAATEVAASGEARRLAPMNPFERKVVHDAVAVVAGVRSESEGEEPQRRVVVLPV